jgi:hypothetical protein
MESLSPYSHTTPLEKKVCKCANLIFFYIFFLRKLYGMDLAISRYCPFKALCGLCEKEAQAELLIFS